MITKLIFVEYFCLISIYVFGWVYEKDCAMFKHRPGVMTNCHCVKRCKMRDATDFHKIYITKRVLSSTTLHQSILVACFTHKLIWRKEWNGFFTIQHYRNYWLDGKYVLFILTNGHKPWPIIYWGHLMIICQCA